MKENGFRCGSVGYYVTLTAVPLSGVHTLQATVKSG